MAAFIETRMFKSRVFFAVLMLAVLLAGFAAYLSYAPKSPLPANPVEIVTLEVNGTPRRYTVFTPSNLQPGAGVLLAYHSSFSNGEEMRRITGHVFERLAEMLNFVVIYPDGYEGQFNDCRRMASYSARQLNIDDVGLAKIMIQRLAVSKKIDTEQVFAVGYSTGGHMALRLAIETPDLVKGAIVVAANLPAPDNMDCHASPSLARFIVFVEGTNDPINPYDGGPVSLFGLATRGNVLSARDSASWFAIRLGLRTLDGKEARVGGIPVFQQDWMSDDGHVRLLTVAGGGHTLPQRSYRFPRLLGSTLPSDGILESSIRLVLKRES